MIISISYALFLAVWRRCFGCSGWDLPIIKHRVVQHIIGFVACFIALYFCDKHLIQCTVTALLLQGLFWARSHGCCYDFGHGPVDVKRYEQLWYWKFLKKHIPETMLYTYSCDFLLMNLRYTLPAILIAISSLNPLFLFAGLVLTGIYALMWSCYDVWWTKKPTDIAEIISGLLIGFLLTAF